jgi:Icc-related predicted phosphoesterase
VRVAAVGDIHVRDSHDRWLRELLEDVCESADVLFLCGDLTDHGLESEAIVLGEQLVRARIPTFGVLGNHDYESGQQAEVAEVLREAGMVLLDADCCHIDDVGIVGVKGFCGGFGQYLLAPWGEPAIKQFVYEAVEEAMKLERQLTQVHAERTLVILHYSPIRETVDGEPPEIIPFLGSSRLAEPIDRFPVDAVFHGHAHYGLPVGCTPGGRTVYNCALPLMRRVSPERPFVPVDV